MFNSKSKMLHLSSNLYTTILKPHCLLRNKYYTLNIFFPRSSELYNQGMLDVVENYFDSSAGKISLTFHRISGDVKISHSRMTKEMLGNFGNRFVKCMRQVTEGHFYHLLGV